MQNSDFLKLLQSIENNAGKSLRLSGCSFTQEQKRQLCHAIANNKSLTSLKIFRENFGPEEAEILAQNTSLNKLSLEDNQVGDNGAIALSNNNSITKLTLWNNNIGPEGAKALAQNHSLTELSLCENNIGLEGAIALSQNTSITALHLGENHLGPESALAMANNKSLKILNIRDNDLGDQGAKALAQNTVCTAISLDNTNIHDEGLIALAHNTKFIYTDLSDNNFSKQSINHFINIVLNTPCSRIIVTKIPKIDDALKTRKDNFTVLANKYLPGIYTEPQTFNKLNDEEKVVLLFDKLQLIQCYYQVMQHFQSKNKLKPCKFDSTILPSEMLCHILSFMYPQLTEKDINQSWQRAEETFLRLSFS